MVLYQNLLWITENLARVVFIYWDIELFWTLWLTQTEMAGLPHVFCFA